MRLSSRRLLIPVFYFFQLNLPVQAQPPSFGWVRTMGSVANHEAAVGMVLDSNKAVIIAGNFRDLVDFNAGSGIFNLNTNGVEDVFITKYTSNGNFVWAKSIGGTSPDFVRAFKKDRQGNIYLLGIYQSTVDFDPGPGVFNVTSIIGSSSFLVKLDNNGNFIWVKTWSQLFGNTLDIDDNGNILVGGYFTATRDFDPGPGIFNMTANVASRDDMFIMKLDNTGNFSWAKQLRNLGSSEHQEFGLETDPTGNIFFAGNFTQSIDFDPSPATFSLTSNGFDDAFIIKLNTQGDFQWVSRFGGSGSDKPFGLEVDRQGNVFSTGMFFSTVDFDPGPGSFLLTAPTPNRSAFISKLDPSGNFVYAKNFQVGESFGQDLAIDSSNNLYISGGFHGTVDFDPGPGTYNIPVGELFTVKLDINGNFGWAAGYTPTVSIYFESVYSSVLVDQSNNVYFAGSFPGTVDFDPGPGSFPVASNGAWDIYLHKLGPAPCNGTYRTLTAQTCSNYVLNGVTYTSSGQYYQQLTNSAGCDSIIQLDLTITKIQTNLSQTSCGPYIWNGRTLNSSGEYRDTVHLTNGCDSIIVLNLTVNNKPVPNLGIDTVLCIGDTIHLSAGNFAGYVWNNGSTSSSISVIQPGIYWVNVTAANGCTARDTLNITTSNRCLSCSDPSLIQKIYPVPINNTLTVQIKPSICNLKMDIYNILGQLIIKGYTLLPGKNILNMERYQPATYFYRIYNGNDILSEGKVLKQ